MPQAVAPDHWRQFKTACVSGRRAAVQGRLWCGSTASLLIRSEACPTPGWCICLWCIQHCDRLTCRLGFGEQALSRLLHTCRHICMLHPWAAHGFITSWLWHFSSSIHTSFMHFAGQLPPTSAPALSLCTSISHDACDCINRWCGGQHAVCSKHKPHVRKSDQ